MIQELVYPQHQLPEHLKWQILSFLRVEWPDGFVGPNRLRDWITSAQDHPISFLLVENDLVISHAQVVWKFLEHTGETYKVYGLTGVFTYPSFRRQGYGKRVVASATAYVDASDGDIGMVHTRASTVPFYARNGWIPMETAVTLVGPKQNPVVSEESVLMRFLTEKGQKGRATFESVPFYFGDAIW